MICNGCMYQHSLCHLMSGFPFYDSPYECVFSASLMSLFDLHVFVFVIFGSVCMGVIIPYVII